MGKDEEKFHMKGKRLTPAVATVILTMVVFTVTAAAMWWMGLIPRQVLSFIFICIIVSGLMIAPFLHDPAPNSVVRD